MDRPMMRVPSAVLRMTDAERVELQEWVRHEYEFVLNSNGVEPDLVALANAAPPFAARGWTDDKPTTNATSQEPDLKPLFPKYHVQRADGKDAPGGKHDGCFLFVLDVDCDPDAPAALAVYADRVKNTRPRLYADLMVRLSTDGLARGTALERAKALFMLPVSQLPGLAVIAKQRLAARVGLSAEVVIAAFAWYAQAIEGFSCPDRDYLIPDEERAFLEQYRDQLDAVPKPKGT